MSRSDTPGPVLREVERALMQWLEAPSEFVWDTGVPIAMLDGPEVGRLVVRALGQGSVKAVRLAATYDRDQPGLLVVVERSA